MYRQVYARNMHSFYGGEGGGGERSPHVGCLYSTCSTSWLQARCLPLWCSLCPASISKPQVTNLDKALQQVAATRRAVRQWIPAHCGISQNEQVHILAKEGAREQQNNNVSFTKKEDPHQSTQDTKVTEGWLSPAVLGAASRFGEASYQT